MIWCINYLNVHIYTFRFPWSFIWGCFFSVSILSFFSQISLTHCIQELAVRIPTMLVIIFWNFSLFQCSSDSPQIKQNLISNMTNFIDELPREFPNDWRLRKLGNIRKVSNLSGDSLSELAMAVKKYAKADIKVLQSCPILRDFFTLFQIFYSVIAGTYTRLRVTDIYLNVRTHNCCL